MIFASGESLAGSTIGWYLVAAVGLIIVNGIYVAYEFAVITARRSTFESDAVAHRWSSRLALSSMSDLSTHLAGAQLGITMASLALGYVGEPAFAALVEKVAGGWVSPDAAEVIGLILGFGTVIFLHLVLGEMVPKNIALAAPDATMRWLVIPYRAYLRVTRPFVALLNSMANAGCRMVGIEPRDELIAVHSTGELASIVDKAGERGSITAGRAELLQSALQFAQRPVCEVATPIGDAPTLAIGATVAQVGNLVVDTGSERIFVLYPGSLLEVGGYVHARDVLAAQATGRLRAGSPVPADMIREITTLGADQSLIVALRVMRQRGRQVGLVVDGESPVGLVTVEELTRALVRPSSLVSEQDLQS